MKEQYISPVLQVCCFVPVERLANTTELENVELLTDISTYGVSEPGAGFDDGDFGVEIP